MVSDRLSRGTHTRWLWQPNLVVPCWRFHACFAPRITCSPTPAYRFQAIVSAAASATARAELINMRSAMCTVAKKGRGAKCVAVPPVTLWARSWHWACDIFIRNKLRVRKSQNAALFHRRALLPSRPNIIIIKCSSIRCRSIAHISLANLMPRGIPFAGALWLWNATQSHQQQNKTHKYATGHRLHFDSQLLSSPTGLPDSTPSPNAGAVWQPNHNPRQRNDVN